MTAEQLRKKFLDFFESKGHKIIPGASLVPENDPTVLFTTAGMQKFKSYYLGEKSPHGDNVVSVQKCFRSSDIEEVGDEFHLTFFEMLGNFSFGGYFKKEAIEYAHEFITKELGLKIDYVTIFEEENEKDEESEKKWKGIDSKLEIKKGGRKDNFWGPTGDEGPCGPTTEIYVNGVEIWNLVFNEYYKSADGKYTKLEIPGVDTGMGLERLAMVVQNKNNVFETDLFTPIIKENTRAARIIADHIKAAVFILAEGIEPSNVKQGYVLRRLIRRAVRYGKIKDIAEKVIEIYKNVYPELEKNKKFISEEIKKEGEKFGKTLERGLREFEKGTDPFVLFTTYGFPVELTQELAKEKGIEIDIEKFNEQLKQHQELSRTASVGMFKSGLADQSEQAVKYHTASHLLLAALRQVLGEHVVQRGSNITVERLRLDFSHSQKMTEEEIKRVEDLVNEKIKENIPVICKEMNLEEAREKGAMGVFENKYGEKVKVYTINNFSREICSGPHVNSTGELRNFKITKEEASSAGIRRIKAVLL